jgi:dihydrofolate reductase
VFSKKLKKSDPMVTGWKHSVVIRNLSAIKKLKDSKGPNIQVWGSSKLIHLLLKHDLVDELRLKIHPLILGKGKKLFDDGIMPAAFKLTESVVTPGGVIIASYKRAGKVKTGTIEV